MGFAEWMLKIGIDGSKSQRGANDVINQLKKIGDSSREIARKSEVFQARYEKHIEQEKAAAFARLKPEEQLNKLLKQREDIQRRLMQSGSARASIGYKAKIAELDSRISGVRSGIPSAGANRKEMLMNALEEIPGFSRISSLFTRFSGAGAAALAGGAAVVGAGLVYRNRVKNAQGLQDESAKTGLSIDSVQKARASAAATGTEPEKLYSVFEDIRKSQSNALSGEEKSVKAFERLGFSVKELEKLAPDEIFYRLARSVDEGSIDFGAFLKVAGDGAKDILPAMKNGIADIAKEYEDAGDSIFKANTATIESLAQAGDAFVKYFGKAKTAAGGLLTNISGIALGVSKLGAAGILNIGAGLGSKAAGEARDNLGAQVGLIFDKDYAASLKKTAELEAGKSQAEAKRLKELNDLVEFYGLDQEQADDEEPTPEKRRITREQRERPTVDSLAQRGLFVGSFNAQLDALQKQVNIQSQTLDEIKRVNRNLTAE